jgi:flagellar hook-associated protein 2
MSDKLRITGMASGLDVESTVKQMMKPYNMRMDKAKQDRQIVQWKQDLYRDIIGDVNTFKSTYFDVLKSDSYMLSSNSYTAYDIKSSNDIKATAVGSTGAKSGTYTLTDIVMAKNATTSGAVQNSKQANNAISFPVDITSNTTFSVKIGSLITDPTYTVTVPGKASGYSNLSELASSINAQLKNVTGGTTSDISSKVKAVVSSDGTKIDFQQLMEVNDSNSSITLNISDGATTTAYKVSVDKGSYTADELSNLINKNLDSVITGSPAVNTSIVDKIKATVQPDGSIAFSGINTYSFVSSSSSYAPSDSISVTDSNNVLTPKIKIKEGVNDSLTVTFLNGDGTTTAKTFSLLSGTEFKAAGGSGYAEFNTLDDLKQRLTDRLAAPDVSISNNDLAVSLSSDPNNVRFKLLGTSGNVVNLKGTALDALGFPSSGIDMKPVIGDKMTNILSTDSTNNGVVDFTINGVNLKFNFFTTDKDRSIDSVLSEISSKANVKISYSELAQKFTISSSKTGSDQTIDFKDNNGKFMQLLFGITDTTGNPLKGSDASVTIKDPTGATSRIIKSSNTFTVDGMNYNLLQNTVANEAITLTATANSQKVFDKIKAFIDKYNDIVDKVNKKVDEKRQYSYLPLTDDQKKDMKEDEIKTWEDKAKQGLLKNDSGLENMLYSMRRAFFDKIDDVGISLRDLGMSTSSDTTERGKIVFDPSLGGEQKLKDAIINNPKQVEDLFMKKSSNLYSTDGLNQTRYDEEGIFQRISDVLQDYTRTTRSSNGLKGILLEKAGVKGDFTEFNNILSNQIKDKDKAIKDLVTKLSDKQEKYYLMFSKLETAMNKLNSQSSWLAQQLGSGQ